MKMNFINDIRKSDWIAFGVLFVCAVVLISMTCLFMSDVREECTNNNLDYTVCAQIDDTNQTTVTGTVTKYEYDTWRNGKRGSVFIKSDDTHGYLYSNDSIVSMTPVDKLPKENE